MALMTVCHLAKVGPKFPSDWGLPGHADGTERAPKATTAVLVVITRRAVRIICLLRRMGCRMIPNVALMTFTRER